MAEKCPKIVRRHCKHNFRTFLGHFLPVWSVLLFGDPVQCSPVTTLEEKFTVVESQSLQQYFGIRAVLKSLATSRTVPEYCWLARLVSGMAPSQGSVVRRRVVSKRVVLADFPRHQKPGTRVHPDVPWYQKPQRGYIRMFPGTKKTGTRAHSPKLPFYETALLFLLERPISFPNRSSNRTLSGLPNANAKSQRFSYATSQIATLPPVVALNRKSQLDTLALNRKSQLDTLRFGTQFPKSHWPLSFSVPKAQRFKSQRLQDANATKSQTLAFYKPQRFSATKTVLGDTLNFCLCK